MKLLALTIPGDTPVKIQTPPGIPSGVQLGPLITFIISALFVAGIFVTTAYLLYGGLYWIFSKGEKEKVERARKIIIYSIVGLVIMSLSLVIVNVATTAVGVPNIISGK